jgi:hypothetical protein
MYRRERRKGELRREIFGAAGPALFQTEIYKALESDYKSLTK